MNYWETLTNKLNNNKAVGWVLNRKFFTIVYLTICVLWFFPLLGYYLDLISQITFVWGALLILWDLFTKRHILQAIYWKLIIFFFISFAITIILNFSSGIYMNIKHLIYNGILLLIIYIQDPTSSEDDLKKYIYEII